MRVAVVERKTPFLWLGGLWIKRDAVTQRFGW